MASIATAALPSAYFLSENEPTAARRTVPALSYFDATTLEEAQPLARAVYASADGCPRCRSLLAHRFDRLGSTLFRDDDPRALLRAFDAADRDGCSARLLAACIVLFGRERVGVH